MNSGEIIDCNEHHNTCKSDSLNCARGAIRKIVFWLRKIGLGLRKIVFWLRKIGFWLRKIVFWVRTIGLGLRKMVPDLSPVLSPHSLARSISGIIGILENITRSNFYGNAPPCGSILVGFNFGKIIPRTPPV